MMTTPALRPWSHSDAPALLRAVQSGDDLDAQFGGSPPTTIAAAEAVIDGWAPAEQSVVFSIDWDGQAVGAVGLSHIEHRHDTAWAWYWLAVDVRGRGLATRALATVAAWAFADLGLHRLELGHRVNNPASCRVALRAGFAAEGVERAKLRYGNERFDVETHARLVTDPPPEPAPLTLALSARTGRSAPGSC